MKLLVETVAREKKVLRGEKISNGGSSHFGQEAPALSVKRRCNCQYSHGSPGY